MLLCHSLKIRIIRSPRLKPLPFNQYIFPSKRLCRYASSIPDVHEEEKFPTFKPSCIRNFSIIAHVDHGKSTLADRLIEIGCGVKGEAQQLDSLQVEKERGITVKAQSAALRYTYKGVDYLLNLIDTPGHVDFSHEVKRSLFISDGAILLVDATQGVQAQTVSNFYTAFESDVAIIGAVNKIDMSKADAEVVMSQMNNLFDIDLQNIMPISAKTGLHVEKLFPHIVELLPPPNVERNGPFQALLHDCQVLARGMMVTVFVKSGVIKPQEKIHFIESDTVYDVKEVGVFIPNANPTDSLSAGQVGYIIANIKDITKVHIGDTICTPNKIVQQLLPCAKAKPVVFAGFYPDDESDHNSLSNAINKLLRSDTSVSIAPDSNYTLGRGWNLGFLGMLHMDVFSQRLEQEFATTVIITSPSITYRATMVDGSIHEFNNPTDMVHGPQVTMYEEPVVLVTLVVPLSCMSSIISMCQNRRGIQKEVVDLNFDRFMIKYEIPVAETIIDFYSELKRLSSGYASCDFEDCGYQPTNITRCDIMLNGNVVDGLASIVRTECLREFALSKVQALAKTLPRQQFLIAIQALQGRKVVARDNVKPFTKDVTSALYGGDQSRRRKVIDRQKNLKRTMRTIGKIKIPKEAFRVMIYNVKK